MNYNQIKKHIILLRSIRELANPIEIKLDMIKGIAKIKNKTDTKLKIVKDSHSKKASLIILKICTVVI